VDICLSDYRDAEGTYDKVVSIGMCEHVGWKNLRPFVKLAADHLKPEGMFLLHTIGGFRPMRVEETTAQLITAAGAEELPLMSKADVADAILDEILRRRAK
jgi:cyclopropane fatty-acyl-phospholipid synthase-like methyltransferase